MPRTLSNAMITAIESTVIKPDYLLHLNFTGADLFLTTNDRNLQFNSVEYLANDILLEISEVEESLDGEITNLKVTLAGEDTDVLSLVLSQLNQSCTATLHLALHQDTEENLIVNLPYQLFHGKFDTSDIEISANAKNIVLSYENEFIIKRRIIEHRYTDQSQQSKFPGDTGFRYASQVEEWNGFWGKAARPEFIRKRKVPRKR